MISFRYHIVSLVAVFLALAVGIVVGSTALNGPVTTDLRHQVSSLKHQRSDLTGQVKALHTRVDNAGQFVTTYGAQLLAGALKGTTVMVIGLPGASTGTEDGIAHQITAAGAHISGRLQLANSYIDSAQGASIDKLATTTHPIGLTLPTTSDPGRLGGALLAYALLGKGQPSDLKTVLSGFAALHMISSDPRGVTAAKTFVVVGNGALKQGSYPSRTELDLVTALQAAGGGVVVAGDSGSATEGGVVAAVRSGADKAVVSTVDNANSSYGQVSTVLALGGIAKSQVGQYGTAKGASSLFPAPRG